MRSQLSRMEYVYLNCKPIVHGTSSTGVCVCRASGFEPPLICTPSELMDHDMTEDPIVEDSTRFARDVAELAG